MPDWKKLICEQVGVLRVCPAEFTEELVREWASHLEESFETFLSEGLSFGEAYQRGLQQIRQLAGARSQVRILQEVLMRGFTKQVALPGLVTFALAMAFGGALDFAGIPPRTILFSNGLFLSLPTSLFCVLPLCGAAGAFISRRNGGGPLQRITASLFLPAIMGSLFTVGVIAGWITSRIVPSYGWNWSLVVRAFALWLTGYAILPAIPLVLGSVAEVKLSSMRKPAV